MAPWTVKNVSSRYWRAHGYVVSVRKHGVSVQEVNHFRRDNPGVKVAGTNGGHLMFKSLNDLMLFKLVCA